MMLHHVMPDGVHQVGLSKSDSAVNEQRVVGSRRRLRNRATGGVRKLVRRSDDEAVEGVAGDEAAGAWWMCRRVAVRLWRRRKYDLVGGRALETAPGHATFFFRRGPRGVRNEHQFHVRPAHLAQRFGQDDRVVLGQLFDEQGVWNPDRKAVSSI